MPSRNPPPHIGKMEEQELFLQYCPAYNTLCRAGAPSFLKDEPKWIWTGLTISAGLNSKTVSNEIWCKNWRKFRWTKVFTIIWNDFFRNFRRWLNEIDLASCKVSPLVLLKSTYGPQTVPRRPHPAHKTGSGSPCLKLKNTESNQLKRINWSIYLFICLSISSFDYGSFQRFSDCSARFLKNFSW